MTAQNHDPIKWSDETYSLGELMDKFQSELPCIVKVATGYNGPSPAETLSSEQVLHVHSSGHQTRVLGKDAGGRRFSIPLLFSVPFTLTDQPSGLLGRKKTYSLAAILENNSLPVKIDLADNGEGSMSQGIEFLSLGTIQLVSTYEEKSIIGNMISDGDMSQTPVAVPMYIAVSVSVAEGRVDNDVETWSRLKADYRRSAALVDYSSVPRANDVMWYSARQVNDVIRHAQTPSADSVYLALVNERSPDKGLYTSLDNTGEGGYYNLERTSSTEPQRALYQNVNIDGGSEYATLAT